MNNKRNGDTPNKKGEHANHRRRRQFQVKNLRLKRKKKTVLNDSTNMKVIEIQTSEAWSNKKVS